MNKNKFVVIALSVLMLPLATWADDLTKMIQEDLTTLGYEPGEINGETTIPTVVAVSQFQAEHDLEVTGELTPQLAGIIKANMDKPAASQAVEPAAAPAPSPDALQAAQQQCLMEHHAAAQKKQKTTRGISSLLSAVTRTSGQTGNYEVAADISNASSDLYNANATASDLSSAAKDLGLTEDQVEACRNPL